MNVSASETRPYRQKARAAAAEATAERILACFTERLRSDWFDEIKLDEVARSAGVTVQTVIRRYGGKAGLLEAAAADIGQEVIATRIVATGDALAAIGALSRDYEASGDLVVRLLAQEDRHPALRQVTEKGRQSHRKWIEAVFEPWLRTASPADRRRAVDRLVIVSDVYVWKLVRRDMGRPAGEYRRILAQMLAEALGTAPEILTGGSAK